MTVEEKRVIIGREEGHGDKFPVGMRVLAVDDDPICLKVLETLLLRCQYHVTTTNQAIKALNMLRGNKDKFDLVISDVHMPDMDGFKLLELVGLEMDLPVIMLSANGETKAVMKGITHGACDYLLKPVRIEELRNIWQHVVRRRKFDRKEHCIVDNGEGHEELQAATSEGFQATNANGPEDRNVRVHRKRKDQNDEDDYDYEEGAHESEDLTGQKKPRVVWSVELHRKFVAAVNQLGIDKAVPKRILDLMNVDKLTRENVASHLQKYRLYLKRLSAVASQQANIAAALGGRDSSYLHMTSFNDFGSFHGLTTFQPNTMSNRANPNFLGFSTASGMIQIGSTQDYSNNPMNDLSNFQHVSVPVNQHEHSFQDIPKQKGTNESINDLQDVFTGTSNNSFIGEMNKSPLLRGSGNQPAAAIPSFETNHFETGSAVPAHLPDARNCSDTWQNVPSLNACNANSLAIGVSYSDDSLTSSIMGVNLSSTVPLMGENSLNISSNNLFVTDQDSFTGRDMQCQSISLWANSPHNSAGFNSVGNAVQKLDSLKQQSGVEPSIACGSSFNSSIGNWTLLNNVADSQMIKNRFFNEKVNTATMNQPSFESTFSVQYAKPDKSSFEGRLIFNEDYKFGSSKMQGGLVSNKCNFDELMNVMIESERDDIGFIDGEIGCDLFPLSTCL